MQEVEKARETLETIQIQNTDLVKWFESPKIVCLQDQLNYQDILTSAKIAYKKAKDEQDHLLEPLKESEKRIRDLFKPLLEKYGSAITTISSLLNQWHTEQKKITEAQIMQEAQAYWDKAKEAKETGESVALPDLGISAVSDKSRHNLGTTNYRRHIKVQIINPNKIPRQYCTPSESLLRKAGELGITAIEGAIIEIEYIPVSRPVK
jgi:hypothetical protein